VCFYVSQTDTIFLFIDGNFGLCRKKAAGSSVRPPLHEQTMFVDQDKVDEYVSGYGYIYIYIM